VTARSSPLVLVKEDEVRSRVAALGAEVSASYPDGVVLVGLLKAGVWLLADLVRQMSVSCQVDFLGVSSYGPERRARVIQDVEVDLAGRDVVLVDALVDTGLKASFAIGELARRGARSVEVCALVDRRARRIVPTPVRFCGFEYPIAEVLDPVGWGLDNAQQHRNLPHLAGVARPLGGSFPGGDGTGRWGSVAVHLQAPEK